MAKLSTDEELQKAYDASGDTYKNQACTSVILVLAGQARGALGIEFCLFEVVEDFLGPMKDAVGQTGQPRNLDSVALIGTTRQDLSQKDYLIVPFAHGNIEVYDTRTGALEIRDFVVVRRKQRAAAYGVVEVLGDAPGDGKAVKC